MDDDTTDDEVFDLDQEPIPGLGVMPEGDADDPDPEGVGCPAPDADEGARGLSSSTVAPTLMLDLAHQWEDNCGFKSAQFSGCVGDERHRRRGGYHIGRAFQPGDNYSVVRPDDKVGPADTASALDMTMNTADMKLCTSRLAAVFINLNDPRRKYINAFNGTLGGNIARRWDVYARLVGYASQDHVHHVHLEIRRRYVLVPAAMVAAKSVLIGESAATYLAKIGGVLIGEPVPAPAFGGKTLQRSDKPVKNAAVQQFQTQLIKRGMTSIGKADGYFGPKLQSAVKVLQRSSALTPDGIIGPKTWPLPWSGRAKK